MGSCFERCTTFYFDKKLKKNSQSELRTSDWTRVDSVAEEVDVCRLLIVP